MTKKQRDTYSQNDWPDIKPTSAQEEQDEVIAEWLAEQSNTREVPMQSSQKPSAIRSPGLLDLKSELLEKGMSDEEAEEFLRQI